MGREHPRRGRRADLPAVRGEGRRSVRAHRVLGGPYRCAGARRGDRLRRLRDRSPSTTPAIISSSSAASSSSATPPRASLCSSTGAGTGASRSRGGERATCSSSPRPVEALGDVDARRGGEDRDHRFGDREQPADEHRCRRRTRGSPRRGSRRRAHPGRAPSGRRCPARALVSPARGSRGAIHRSYTRWRPFACGPTSAAIARSRASAGTSHVMRNTKAPRRATPTTACATRSVRASTPSTGWFTAAA